MSLLLGCFVMFLFVLVGYFMVLMIYMVFWEMWKTRNETESVVDITKAYLSQLKIVHILRDFDRPVHATENSEYWISTIVISGMVMVNCVATDFKIGVGCISENAIRRIYILFVKRSEIKTTIYLACLFVFHPG